MFVIDQDLNPEGMRAEVVGVNGDVIRRNGYNVSSFHNLTAIDSNPWPNHP